MQSRIEILLAAALSAGVLASPAWALDEEPQDASYDAAQDASSAPPDAESRPLADAPEAPESEGAVAAEPEAPVATEAPSPRVEAPVVTKAQSPPVEAPVVTEAQSPPVEAPVVTEAPSPPMDAPIVTEAPSPPVETPALTEVPSPPMELPPAESATPAAAAAGSLAAETPAPAASPLPEAETAPPEPLASPLPDGETLLAPDVEPAALPEGEASSAIVEPDDAPSAEAGTSAAAPAPPPAAEGDALPADASAAGDTALPVADEAGVLPGLPEDARALEAESAPDAAKPAVQGPTAEPEVAGPASPATVPVFPEETPAPAVAESPPPDVQRTLFLLGTEVPPGAIDWLSWAASESFEGISTPTPVLVVNGTSPGPTLCLTAAVHGDELNGVEMVRRVMYSLDPKKLDGAVIGVPIVNLHGFRRSSRYLPDRRDLNRYFPGSPTGSSAARIAYSFFHEIIVHCDQLVDLHTGSFHRANLPQLRADLDNPEVVEMTEGFGATVVLHSQGAAGTLRRAATDAGIPAVTLEAGEPMRLQPKEVAHGVKGIETLLDKLGMVNKVSLWGDPQPVYYDARWIRANSGGILFSNVNLGERIRKGEVLGTVTDPITNRRTEIRSPYEGRIIGRALNQVVMPGFAAFHIGIRTPEGQLPAESATAAEGQPESPGAVAAVEDAPPAEADAAQADGEALGYEEEEERPE